MATAETAFLDAIADFLGTGAGLSPAPATVGAGEPAQNTDLPAVVLSLEEVHRLGAGLGERSAMITDGALPWTATIDLANPVLPEEPSFVLLSADRLTLILPHGGLRQADGGDGPLGPGDLSVTVAGGARTVVNHAPGPTEVRADPLIGQLTFGSALPATGKVVANYVLGQWERRVTEIAGTLRVFVRAGDAGTVATLSDAVVDALMGAPRVEVHGLRKIAVSDLSSIGVPDPTLAGSRGRSARFSFDYEHEINQPESSGGVIRRVPITSRLNVVAVDRITGAIVTGVVTETD
jgi:hypothetical protein